MQGLDFQGTGKHLWSVRVDQEVIAAQVLEMITAIEQVAFPFFDRFNTMVSARDALVNNDTWCFGGPSCWDRILLLDLAMGEPDHFDTWLPSLKEPYKSQAIALREKSRVLV